VNSKISFRRFGAGRQLTGHLRHALGHELARPVVVGVGLELHGHLRDAQLRIRPDAAHIRQAGQFDLQRDGEGGLQFLGPHRRVLRDDVEHRRREIGKDVAPEILQPQRADYRASRHQQSREQRRAKRGANRAIDHHGLSGRRGRRWRSRPGT
jgi:hypothetical protein